MSLVSRISLAFLAALALILAGFSISVHSLIALRLYQTIDQELTTKLDRFEVARSSTTAGSAGRSSASVARRSKGPSRSGPKPRSSPEVQTWS